nr:histone deacetylase 6 isoform X5 [Cavia porcellus]
MAALATRTTATGSVRGRGSLIMSSTGQDSTTTRHRRSRHNPQSPLHDSSVTSKRNTKKGAVPRSSPNLAEVKKKGKMKKLSQAVEDDLIIGFQELDVNPEAKIAVGTGLVFDEQLNEFHCLWDDSFPERPERLHAIKEQLMQEGLLDRCVSFQARFAEKEELMLVHSLEFIDLMETTQYMNEGELRVLADTYDSVYLHPNSYTCACLASGSVLRLVDAVLGAEIRNGMAIVRPPGHHAQHSLMDGYCMFNHVAVAARYAQKKHRIQRVLIVDWDVHHGQGTQFTFDQDPRWGVRFFAAELAPLAKSSVTFMCLQCHGSFLAVPALITEALGRQIRSRAVSFIFPSIAMSRVGSGPTLRPLTGLLQVLAKVKATPSMYLGMSSSLSWS